MRTLAKHGWYLGLLLSLLFSLIGNVAITYAFYGLSIGLFILSTYIEIEEERVKRLKKRIRSNIFTGLHISMSKNIGKLKGETYNDAINQIGEDVMDELEHTLKEML